MVDRSLGASVQLASVIESLHAAQNGPRSALPPLLGSDGDDVLVSIPGLMADVGTSASSPPQPFQPIEIPVSMGPATVQRIADLVLQAQEHSPRLDAPLLYQLLLLFEDDEDALAAAIDTALDTTGPGGAPIFERAGDHVVAAPWINVMSERSADEFPGVVRVDSAKKDVVLGHYVSKARSGLHKDAAQASAGIPEDNAPAYDAAAPTAQEKWIVIDVEDHVKGEAFEQGRWYTLAVYAGKAAADSIGTAPLGDLFPADIDGVDLDVTVTGWHAEVDLGTRVLPVRRGEARSKVVRFDFRPTDVESRLEVLITRERNICLVASIELTCGDPGAEPVVTFARRPWSVVARTPPRAISIRISRIDDRIQCVFTGDKGVESGMLGAREADLRALCPPIYEAIDALMQVISDPAGPHGNRTGATSLFDLPDRGAAGDDLKAAIPARIALTGSGKALFNNLFVDGDEGAQTIGRRLQEQCAGAEPLRIQVLADDDLHIPWGLLYLGSIRGLDDPGRWEEFLGTRHLIEEYRPVSLSEADREPSGSGTFRLSFTGYASTPPDEVAVAADAQRAYLANRVARMPGGTFTDRPGRTGAFRALGGKKPGDLVYLFCHGDTRDQLSIGGPGASNVRFGPDEKNDALTFVQLTTAAKSPEYARSGPLIVINACQIGRRSPVDKQDLVSYLIRRRARGVIAATAYVPVAFGVSWAIGFFDRLLAGAEIGTTMAELSDAARRVWGMPLGLLYTANCSLETRIAPRD